MSVVTKHPYVKLVEAPLKPWTKGMGYLAEAGGLRDVVEFIDLFKYLLNCSSVFPKYFLGDQFLFVLT